MPGSGFKTFNTGDILTAADVNGYLMKQAVMYFATSTARSTALTAPEEGMVTYLADTNRIEYYDGTAWQPILDQDVIAAKGDLIVGTGDDTVSRLAVGTNDHVLTADSSTATGLKWAAVAAGGKVLQVVSATHSTDTNNFTATYADSGLTASITPSATSSKVLVLISQPIVVVRSTFLAAGSMRLLRGATEIYETGGTTFAGTSSRHDGSTFSNLGITWSCAYLDSPNTTSSTTYKTQGRPETTTNSGYITFQPAAADASIVLLEIGA